MHHIIRIIRIVLLGLLVASCGREHQDPSSASSDPNSPDSTSAGDSPESSNSENPKSCCEELAQVEPLPDTSIYQLESRWRDQRDRPRTLRDFRGHVQIAGMIFTTCEYACPRIMSNLKAVEAQLSAEEKSRVHFLLISFDHEKDKPDVLMSYATKHGLDPDRWTLLHGSESDIREYAAVLGMSFKKSEKVGYSHSNLVCILDSEGRIAHQAVGLEVEASETIAAIRKILK